MKITTWNVNGLRSVLKKGALNWLQDEKPEILCLQEIKVRSDQVNLAETDSILPYHIVWHSAERPGYSGVAILSLEEPSKTILGLGDKRFDIEGRLIIINCGDFWVLNTYFPNGRRDHSRLGFKLEFYEKVLQIVDEIHSKKENIILCGDFNTAHREIDLRNPTQNQNTSGFLKIERECIDKLLEHNMVDIYRIMYPKRVEYTWWTYRANARQRNIGWRLDFFLITSSLRTRIKDVTIHAEIFGSDHCPVTLEMK